MRFLMVDRVLSLEPGRRIETLKLPSISEEYLRGHFTRAPLVPGAMIIESMAQTVGRLVCATHNYTVATVLTLLEDVRVPHDLLPGRPLRIVGELLATSPRGSVGRAEVFVDDVSVAAAGRMLYGQFPHTDPAALKARLRLAGDPP